jgi:ribulose-phosphate 3-epimerase
MPKHAVLIAPSILSADLANLQKELKTVEKYADWLQIDVMDGHFVPNLSFGAPVVECINTKLPIDVHLMVSNPADRIEEFLQAGASHITFHAEAVKSTADRKALIKAIRKGGATAGIAIKPATPMKAIEDVVRDVDLVLVMSVEPGFGGQKFIKAVLPKVIALRARFPKLMIQMDGGIDAKTAGLCKFSGADNLVAGSAVFGQRDRKKAIKALRDA